MRACSRDRKRAALAVVLLALALGLPTMGIAHAKFGSSAAVTISITIAPTSPGPTEPAPTDTSSTDPLSGSADDDD